jgi:hypothetical protein
VDNPVDNFIERKRAGSTFGGYIFRSYVQIKHPLNIIDIFSATVYHSETD